MDLSDIKFISKQEHMELSKRCKPQKDDVLICRIGTLGKALLVDVNIDFSVFVSLGLIKTGSRRLSKYICNVINSGYGFEWIETNKAGGAMHTYKINLSDLNKMFIPLPTVDEIERILSITDNIFSEIDTIEKLQTQYAADSEILKSKLIDAAIQGKLTEQLPSDGTAEELYQQIQTEKQALISAGKIKKEKPLKEIEEDEIPFEIPESWKWVRFGELMWNRDSERIPVSLAKRKGMSKIYDYYGASGVIDKVDDFLFDEKLLLIGEDGANLLSRSSDIAFIAEGKYWVNNHAHVLGYYLYDYLEYVMHYINSISLVPYVTGTAQPKLNQENMNKIPIPLPPLAEQRRILEKIEEFSQFCN